MPGNFLSADTSFPWLNGERSTDEKLSQIQDYLFILLEQLRYTLSNLTSENFNQTAMEYWTETTVAPTVANIISLPGGTPDITPESLGQTIFNYPTIITNVLNEPDVIETVFNNETVVTNIFKDPDVLNTVFNSPTILNEVITPVINNVLYRLMGDAADLTVCRLSTSRRIPMYLKRDRWSHDYYIQIEKQNIRLMRGEVVSGGGTEQARNMAGNPLFWEEDLTGASLDSDGYPWKNGKRISTTTVPTDWPVRVYRYNEIVEREISFGESGSYEAVDIFGRGYGMSEDTNRGRGYLKKNTDSFDLWLLNRSGEKRGVFVGDEYTDIVGLRRTTKLNFSSFDAGYFSEELEGGLTVRYSVEFDINGNPIRISDDAGHTTEITW